VGLADRAGDDVERLSGGERQRVALARTLAPRPPIVVLDEPFASLDPGLRGRLSREVAGWLRELGTAALFVTHDLDEALAIADRIAVLRAGRLVQLAAPAELMARPADPWTASFLGHENVWTGGAAAARCPVHRRRRSCLPRAALAGPATTTIPTGRTAARPSPRPVAASPGRATAGASSSRCRRGGRVVGRRARASFPAAGRRPASTAGTLWAPPDAWHRWASAVAAT
jgi:ABC-type sulfate/molybdate transport systems ATPase subunit